MKLEETQNSKKQWNAFLNELEHMRKLRSPHTVEDYGVVTSFRDELVLVMEYMPGGDLFSYIRKHREMKETISEQVCYFAGTLWSCFISTWRENTSFGLITNMVFVVCRSHGVWRTPSCDGCFYSCCLLGVVLGLYSLIRRQLRTEVSMEGKIH